MGRYTGPKDKLSRREGFDLFGKGNKLKRLSTPPGQHGQSRGRRQSAFGEQLRAKQLAKRLYGLREKQLLKYVRNSLRTHGNTEAVLFSNLEQRLDNVIYRMHLAVTRPMARQLITHGHVQLSGKKFTIPSYQVKPGESITLKEKTLALPDVQNLAPGREKNSPAWIRVQDSKGEILRIPDLKEDKVEPIEIGTIIEFYSR